MIDPVNEILRDLIQSRLPGLAGPSQVAFAPPNDDWSQSVMTGGEERVNLYLYEIRENLKLRSNERTRVPENGWYREIREAARIDCHYLVTAWSPATFTPPVEPTRDEHVLLYSVLDLLMRNRPLVPALVYRPGMTIPSSRTLNSVPAALRDDLLPLDAALPEGLRDQGDFWGTMKVIWRPSIELVVTVPILLEQDEIETPMVTTLIGDYLQGQNDMTTEELLSIGGQVLAGNPAASVGGAWVQIRGMAPPEIQAVNTRTIAQQDGRFVFSNLRAGQYHLRAVAAGVGDIGRDVELPSITGEYDLRFP